MNRLKLVNVICVFKRLVVAAAVAVAVVVVVVVGEHETDSARTGSMKSTLSLSVGLCEAQIFRVWLPITTTATATTGLLCRMSRYSCCFVAFVVVVALACTALACIAFAAVQDGLLWLASGDERILVSYSNSATLPHTLVH